MSPLEVLDSFKHIELTESELTEALIWAKQKKDASLKELEQQQRAEANRKNLTSSGWSYEQTRDYMLYRAGQLFKGEFVLDKYNEDVFNLLCYYFSEDARFVPLAVKMNVTNPSLIKGVLLAGNWGTGKTWLMSLFRKNNRRVFHLAEAKDLAVLYKKAGDDAMEPYKNKIKNAFNDPTVFYQEYAGLCIEDIGAEDIKGHYGDKCLVVGDIIEGRYVNKCLTGWFHGTTNFTAAELKEWYSGRVTDRLRESVNLIELGGPSRRK